MLFEVRTRKPVISGKGRKLSKSEYLIHVGVFCAEIQSGGWLTLTSPAPKRFNDAPFDKATKVEEEGQDG